MSRVLQILNVSIIPDNAVTNHVLLWSNYVIVPLFFMFAGLQKAWSTATTPFEEFLGTCAAVGIALLWPIFVRSLPKRQASP